MKSNIFLLITAIIVLYLYKKGNDASESDESLSFSDGLKKGFKLTVESLNDKIKDTEPVDDDDLGYVGVRAPNEETFSYSNGFSFKHRLPKHRGIFHVNQLLATKN